MTTKLHRIMRLGAALAPLAICQPALAQAEAASDDGTIVVTATKRGTAALQDIPYNISAVGEELLEKTGVTSLEDLARLVPGITSQGGPGNQTVVIRGLASDAGAAQVGIYVDEIPLSGIGGTNVRQSDLGLYDIERIEVLRGPQGTLYGAGSQGGTLRYITNKPDLDDYAASVGTRFGVTKGGGERIDLDAMVNVALVPEAVGLRAVGYYRRADGFVDLPTLGLSEVDVERNYGGRLLLQARLGADTTLLGSFYYQRTEVENSNEVIETANINPATVRSPFSDELRIFNLTLEHDFGFGTLTATGSKYTRETFYTFDVSQFVPGSGRVNQPAETDATTAELRFASNFQGPFQTIVGVFYEKRDRISSSYGGFTGNDGKPIEPAALFFDTESEQYVRNKAAFANVTFDVTDRLQIEGGIRFFKSRRRDEGRLFLDPFGRPPGEDPTQRARSSGNVKRLQVSYDFTDDILGYATFSEGFREGGPNAPALLGNYPLSFGPDFVKNFEAGLKTQLFDKQLTLNGSAYYMKWDDIQVSQTDPTGAFAYTINAGKARLIGFELEGSIRPRALPGFHANFSTRLSGQELTEDNPLAVGPAGDPNAGRKGDRIPGTSSFSANLGVQQNFPLDALSGFVRGDISYTGKARTTFNPADPIARSYGDYTLVNLRAGVEQGGWSAALYVQNLFDVRKPTGWTVQNVAGLPDLIRITLPRQIGITARYQF
ncbi:MAG TPA: TonB-dependent receptor [Sphingopyxis sp.]|nr:TonB-dependent receptor [Sphingopyxis sp.]